MASIFKAFHFLSLITRNNVVFYQITPTFILSDDEK